MSKKLRKALAIAKDVVAWADGVYANGDGDYVPTSKKGIERMVIRSRMEPAWHWLPGGTMAIGSPIVDCHVEVIG